MTSHAPSSRFSLSLAQQIFLGMFVGGLIGWLQPQWGTDLFFLRDIFLNLIKSIIAPLVFSTIVVGIAGSGGAKNVGRMGFRSLLYFEIVTTLALVIGLVVVNLTQPGVGIQLNGTSDAVQTIAQTQPKTLIQTLVHVFPSSIVDALLRGDVLQIVAFSILFGFGISAVGEAAAPVVRVCEGVAQVMFRFTEIVMMFAPIGIGAAMAHTIGHQGLGILVNLGVLIGSLYAALIVFVVLVLGSVAWFVKLPLSPFLRAVKEPFMLAFVTTSSESALPKAMENMERFGVPKRVVGFVMPTGYSFNLDGTTLYLAMASVFLMQAISTTTNGAFQFGIMQQVTMMLALMITSKGVAAVPRASLVILMATAVSFVPAPYQALVGIGVAVIFGVDEFMDMARTSVNLLGNCLATVVIARWEGVFDDAKAHAYGSAEESV
ncbi:MAG: dicarboxylate/amino acid:cation symporter [Candidatus Kapaibacterium sp.]